MQQFGRCRLQRQPHLIEHLRGDECLPLGIPDRERAPDDPHHRVEPRRGQPLGCCPLLGQRPYRALLRPRPTADPARVLTLQTPPNREQRLLSEHHGGTDPRIVDRPLDLARSQVRGGGAARSREVSALLLPEPEHVYPQLRRAWEDGLEAGCDLLAYRHHAGTAQTICVHPVGPGAPDTPRRVRVGLAPAHTAPAQTVAQPVHTPVQAHSTLPDDAHDHLGQFGGRS